MRRLGDIRHQSWRIIVVAVGGLLLAVALGGLVGLLLNQRVAEVTDRALNYDFELQAAGDELKVAVLDLRHYHRNLVFAGPSRGGVEDFEAAYDQLHSEIDDLEELGIRDPEVARPAQLREQAEGYYEGFRPAIESYEEEPGAFTAASDEGLVLLGRLQGDAREIDLLGEERAAESLSGVERVTETARLMLLGALGGLVLVGAALAYAAVRVAGEQQGLYAREQESAERLSRSEERFRALVKNSSDVISVFDAGGTVVYQSPSHERILGYRPEERVGQNVFELPHVHPEDFATKREFFDRTLASEPGELSTAKFRLRDVAGSYHVMEAVGANRLDDPVVRGIVTNYRDVTERHRAEEALRFQKALLESQSEASIDGILVVSGGREVLSWNRRYAEMWGVPEEALESRADDDVLRAVQEKVEDPGGFRRRIDQLYEHPEEESHEEIPLKDGRTFDRYSAPVKSADGTYYGRVWYFRDITGHKRIEEELARSLQAKTDFLADISHELRTPLTVVRGNAEVGLEIESDCPHRGILQKIATESGRMSRMVEDLLLVARYDSSSLPLETASVEVSELLCELVERAEELVRKRAASFETDLEGEGRLRADPARVEQAVLALVDNAAKYSPPGETVDLSLRVRQEELRIEVRDRGPGIPEEELPRIFERFYRTENGPDEPSSRPSGTGLGLSIVRTIAEAHGGRIEAANRPGGGAAMSLYLPLAAEDRPAEPSASVLGGAPPPA